MSPDQIHRRTRQEFREFASGWGVLRLIEDAFDAEGFEPNATSNQSGARRSLFDRYANAIDWQDHDQVQRAIRVFEEILTWEDDVPSEHREKAVAKIRRLLDQDGYVLDDEGRIREKHHPGSAGLPLEYLRDAESNLSQLAVGIAELRNEYGTDHGRTRSSGGLGPRHARLAAGAAVTYCHFLLDRLEDRQRSRGGTPLAS